MKILGIETSCDETAIAVVEIAKNQVTRAMDSRPLALAPEQIKVLSNIISSQVKLHAKYGGVVPNLAAREHVKNIGHVFELALKEADTWGHRMSKIDLIAVTRGPGLGPALLVGITFARTLAWKYEKPLIGVNHLEGHIYSNWLSSSRNSKSETLNSKFFPILNLVVSGGHTELVLMASRGKYKIIGETLDDAVGEAFDKVARLLGLDYPGGPAISRQAEKWKLESQNPKSEMLQIEFPRPMINSKNFNFSYAGLKTSVLYKVRDLKNSGIKLTSNVTNQICYEFQKAALDVLIVKTIKAAQEYKVKSLFLSGGVSANKELRKRLEMEARKLKIKYSQPKMEYTGDNAAMIAVAGYFNFIKNKKLQATYDAAEMDANLGF